MADTYERVNCDKLCHIVSYSHGVILSILAQEHFETKQPAPDFKKMINNRIVRNRKFKPTSMLEMVKNIEVFTCEQSIVNTCATNWMNFFLRRILT